MIFTGLTQLFPPSWASTQPAYPPHSSYLLPTTQLFQRSAPINRRFVHTVEYNSLKKKYALLYNPWNHHNFVKLVPFMLCNFHMNLGLCRVEHITKYLASHVGDGSNHQNQYWYHPGDWPCVQDMYGDIYKVEESSSLGAIETNNLR